jgi:hypothetical protein
VQIPDAAPPPLPPVPEGWDWEYADDGSLYFIRPDGTTQWERPETAEEVEKRFACLKSRGSWPRGGRLKMHACYLVGVVTRAAPRMALAAARRRPARVLLLNDAKQGAVLP